MTEVSINEDKLMMLIQFESALEPDSFVFKKGVSGMISNYPSLNLKQNKMSQFTIFSDCNDIINFTV